MLSRIGNSLFWLGRYTERVEHLARYIYVQYNATLDAPLLQKKEMVNESIARMNGTFYTADNATGSTSKLLLDITLNRLNENSVLSSIFYARENARSARDSISTELWETTNTFYHDVANYPPKRIKTDGPYDFCKLVIERGAMVRGLIDKTLIHDSAWSIVNFGIKLERAIQILRILNTKILDVAGLEKSMLGGPLENYQWTTLMKSCQAFDMSRRFYKSSPNRRYTLEFLLLNPDFTNSVSFCLAHMELHIANISNQKTYSPDSVGFRVGKMKSSYSYLTVDEILDNPAEFLRNAQSKLTEMGDLFEKQYLTF